MASREREIMLRHGRCYGVSAKSSKKDKATAGGTEALAPLLREKSGLEEVSHCLALLGWLIQLS